MRYLSPTSGSMNDYGNKLFQTISGNSGGTLAYNELLVRMWFRRHNAYVLSKAPKDKLLVFSVKEGWGPLCKFLGVPTPDKEFPHKNKTGKRDADVKEYMSKYPSLLRMQRE